eukprot:392408-Pyramimonas_sp.AAC.1
MDEDMGVTTESLKEYLSNNSRWIVSRGEQQPPDRCCGARPHSHGRRLSASNTLSSISTKNIFE